MKPLRKRLCCVLGIHACRFGGFQCRHCGKYMIGLDQPMPTKRRKPTKRHTLTPEDWDA